MKKKLFLISLFLCCTAFAQINIGTPGGNNEQNKLKIQIAQKNAEYNGAIVGYAKVCGGNELEYKQIESLLFKNFKTVGLGDSEIATLKSIYDSNVENAKMKGSNMTKIECNLFMEEFKKIVEMINSQPKN